MAEKSTKKTVAITITRKRCGVPKLVVATGFKLRPDKATGLIDVLLQGNGTKGERVTLDPIMLRNNLDVLKRFVANLNVAQDDAAQKDDVAVSDEVHFSNILQFSQVAGRAETIFGVFSLADWVEASRAGQEGTGEVDSFDNVVAISTAALQKKLVLELILAIRQQGTE